MKTLQIILLTLLLTLTSCERFSFAGFLPFVNTTVNERFEESILLTPQITEITVNNSTYRVYICGDSHHITTSNNYINMLRTAQSDTAATHVLMLGDITDRDSTFTHLQSQILDAITPSFNERIFYAIGNHDLFFNQWQAYKSIFGPSVYSFTVKGPNFSDLYICLDSGNGTIGSKQKRWLEKLLSDQRSKHRHCIIYTHTNIWKTDNSQGMSGNYSTEETLYLASIFSKYKVNLTLSGHDHYRDITIYNNTTYITLDAIKDYAPNASYITLDINNEIEYTFHNIK